MGVSHAHRFIMFFTGFQIFFFFLIGSSYSENRSIHRHFRDTHYECPNELDIYPCTCTNQHVSYMHCNNVKDSTELQRVFKAIKETHYFRAIMIFESPLKKIPAQVFSPHRCRFFVLDNNNIETVENEAFKGSEEYAKQINLGKNRLTRFSFEALTELKSLNILELQNNYLQSIPDNAFPTLEHLWLVNLSFNKIKDTIGKNAFSRLSELRDLFLNDNQLRYLQERSLAFDKQTERVSIQLQNNFIVEIHDEAFAGSKISDLFLDNNNLFVLNEYAFLPLLQDGSKIRVEGNLFDCDHDRNRWLKNLPVDLKQRIKGFKCSNGKGLDDL